mmetsp:Transcript_22221/g.53840  ORF Transcript_22221/g.53840 Transcript_22221/m.53840 type:complete len:139 (-) Transcript_22221:488-904(-)
MIAASVLIFFRNSKSPVTKNRALGFGVSIRYPRQHRHISLFPSSFKEMGGLHHQMSPTILYDSISSLPLPPNPRTYVYTRKLQPPPRLIELLIVLLRLSRTLQYRRVDQKYAQGQPQGGQCCGGSKSQFRGTSSREFK